MHDRAFDLAGVLATTLRSCLSRVTTAVENSTTLLARSLSPSALVRLVRKDIRLPSFHRSARAARALAFTQRFPWKRRG